MCAPVCSSVRLTDEPIGVFIGWYSDCTSHYYVRQYSVLLASVMTGILPVLRLLAGVLVVVSRGYDTCFWERLVMGYADY